MSGIRIIIAKEWRFLLGSDRGVFILYLFLIFSWSMMLVAPQESAIAGGPLWLVFFSVIISANFSNTVFIAERINGTLEILITSGLSRKEILFGKMLFVAGTGSALGFICIGLAYVWKTVMYPESTFSITPIDMITYAGAVAFNTAASAYLSLKLTNPRLMHVATIFMLACIVTLHTVITMFLPLPAVVLPLALSGIAAAGVLLSVKLYESEKILLPVSL